jgi:site-specific DNA recombinase
VAVYVRVSTEEQRERQSIATQREFAEKYCDLHRLEVFQVYADNGVSGTVPIERRPEGRKMLADAREGRFDRLLIYKLDRLGRDTRMILNTVDGLEKIGVGVRSMTEEFDTSTASGRLMLTLLSGFAAHEREMIRERSIAGTKRLASAGAWLGGIVPFGYRKEGEKRESRLVIAETCLDGLAVSEADIVREVYRMAAEDHLSCRVIAEHLTAAGIPCAYTRDDRLLLRGKRRLRTSGIWRAGRIRNLINNRTYMGVHEYGKRSSSREKALIVRSVPAIVSEDTWNRAQQALSDHFLFGSRNAKNRYLLRGLLKCQRCTLTFIGTSNKRPSGKTEFYYRCNGKHSARQIFGAGAKRCSSKDLNGFQLETLIWNDVERFLADPGDLLGTLTAKLASEASSNAPVRRTPEQIRRALHEKLGERGRVLALYRRGRIDVDSLENQLQEIEAEENSLHREQEGAAEAGRTLRTVEAAMGQAEELLQRLRSRLEQGISWELKRELIETLVEGAEIETLDTETGREAVVHVRYRFNPFSSDCTDMDSLRPPASNVPERSECPRSWRVLLSLPQEVGAVAREHLAGIPEVHPEIKRPDETD